MINKNTMYKGYFKNNEYNGIGIMALTDKSSRYIGEFANNNKHGEGILY